MGLVNKACFDCAAIELNSKETPQSSIIQKVASASLKELAWSLALVAITVPFITPPAGMALFVAATVAYVACNTIFRFASFHFSAQLQKVDDPVPRKMLQLASTLCDYLPPLVISPLITATAFLLLHEVGHLAAVKLIFEKVSPKISVTAFSSGRTSYGYSPLSKWGERFGERVSRLIISAAGPVASSVSSTISIAISHFTRKSHPTLSRYLVVAALINIASELLYAAEAFSSAAHPPGHDYAFLKAGGIHPLVSCVALVALPALTMLGLYYLSNKDSARKNLVEN